MKVLDLGSGDRFLKNEFENRGIAYKDYDIYDINFDTDKFSYEDNEFDLIVSLAVLEHIENPNLFLNECKRVLKDNSFYTFLHQIGNTVETLFGMTQHM